MTLNNSSSISNNQTSGRGGGIFNDSYGSCCTVTLNDTSSITGNTAGGDGGGIMNFATVTMAGSSIHNNTASVEGGGIYNSGTLIGAVAGGNVYSNNPDDIFP